KYRNLEDGSQTQYRLCVIESLIPPISDGPVFHFHEIYDEGFYVTAIASLPHNAWDLTRRVAERQSPLSLSRPRTPGGRPRRLRHPYMLSNPSEEEAVFINPITPGFFVRYFQYLEK
ncbi:MAG: hypothetical protein Q9177_004382, partial [Variospora cf. flavescens]